ncbi:MAG TPA: ComF family protein [Patescibacteria group bacterium]|nr:ComF family protein [Patescibacteria group bacterium]
MVDVAGPRLPGPGAVAGRLLDLAFPAVCLGCRREGTALCGPCGRVLVARAGEPAGTLVGMPSDVPLPIVQLEWCAPYGGLVRDALHALKYRGEQRLATPLGAAAAARWRDSAIGGDLLVHVPIHPARRAARGYDQAELLAGAAAALLGLPAAAALRRDRATTPQYELGRDRRADNVAAAFAVDPRHRAALAGRWLVLVDDVVTTGATLAACAGALLDAGAAAVSALTVAREA